MTPQRKFFIIAGPNGAGKTTFAREFLPFEAGCPTFVNADLIAAGLSPFQPDAAAFRAGRLGTPVLDSRAEPRVDCRDCVHIPPFHPAAIAGAFSITVAVPPSAAAVKASTGAGADAGAGNSSSSVVSSRFREP